MNYNDKAFIGAFFATLMFALAFDSRIVYDILGVVFLVCSVWGTWKASKKPKTLHGFAFELEKPITLQPGESMEINLRKQSKPFETEK